MTLVATDVEVGNTSPPASSWRTYTPEVLIVVVLGVTAFIVRMHELPTNGFWLDDAVTAAGLKASPSQIVAVNFDHPGYAAGLMAWSRLIGGSDVSLAYPALIAGIIGPPLLYLVLRRFGYARPIAALLGAALVACQTDIVYSGRVKTYTLDLLIVLVFALVLPRLARLRWTWRTGVLWAVVAVIVGSNSLFSLVATAVAGLVLVLHPSSDLRVRLAAVGTQAAAYVAFILLVGHNYNLGGQDFQWRHTWDAFLNFNPNPVSFGYEVLQHLARLAEVFPGGPAWFATLCVVAALVGLVGTTVERRAAPAIRARYLLLLLFVAFLGALLGKFPFGPTQVSPISSGGRASLWLVPVMAVGLAAILQFLDERLKHRRALHLGFDASLYIAVVVILAFALGQKAWLYPFPGAKTAANLVESQLGPHDVLLVPSPGEYSLAADSDFAVSLHPSPMFANPRIVKVGTQFSSFEVANAVSHAHHVLVYLPEPPFHAVDAESRVRLDSVLAMAGFVEQPLEGSDQAQVEVWHRPTATDRVNLDLSDLPTGWQTRPPAGPSDIANDLACLGDAKNAIAGSRFGATGSAAKSETVSSEVIVWTSADQVQTAYQAFSRPAAVNCVASALQSALRKSGFPTSVHASRVPAPAVNGSPAVAYEETVQTLNGGIPVAQGTILFFTRGSTGVLLSTLTTGREPFPPALLSRLVATLANRVSS